MKLWLTSLVLAISWIGAALAQDTYRPVLRAGVSVQMAAADHAVPLPEADAENATVVAITADGKVFSGTTRTDPAKLASQPATTVFVKADARAAFQTVLAVLDALRGKSVVLLSAPPPTAPKDTIVPPYGVRMNMSK